MQPADILLNHYDMLGGSEPALHTISPANQRPAMFVAIYRGVSDAGALAGFTIGLSLSHPPGGPPGVHKEAMVVMRSNDDAWALAVGFIAYQLREACPFDCGDTIDFEEKISGESEMDAFLIVHPIALEREAREIDLGVRRVSLVQLVPIYREERQWFLSGGSMEAFLRSFKIRELMEPNRRSFITREASPPIL